MRLAPVVIKYHAKEISENFKSLIKYAKQSSLITHPNEFCQDCCAALAIIINRCFYLNNKEDILKFNDDDIIKAEIKNKSVIDILQGSYRDKKRNEIESSGFVLTSLEAAIWCFYKTNSFNDSVLLAANLGYDADTMASITGQISGAYYGFNEINKEWLDKLILKEDLIASVTKLISD